MPVNRHALRVIRERSGLTLSALALLAGISQPHLSNIERGRRQASPALLLRLAESLKVPVVALLTEAEAPPDEGRARRVGHGVAGMMTLDAATLADTHQFLHLRLN